MSKKFSSSSSLSLKVERLAGVGFFLFFVLMLACGLSLLSKMLYRFLDSHAERSRLYLTISSARSRIVLLYSASLALRLFASCALVRFQVGPSANSDESDTLISSTIDCLCSYLLLRSPCCEHLSSSPWPLELGIALWVVLGLVGLGPKLLQGVCVCCCFGFSWGLGWGFFWRCILIG